MTIPRSAAYPAAKALVEKMCERLLANPQIESYEVEIVG